MKIVNTSLILLVYDLAEVYFLSAIRMNAFSLSVLSGMWT